MTKSAFELEEKLIAEGYEFVVGVDEVGRGPLAGPVFAVAASLKNEDFFRLDFSQKANDGLIKKINIIRDSKALSEKQRENIFDFICENFDFGIGFCDHKIIDEINILEATHLAMKKALSALFLKTRKKQVLKKIILIDGNKSISNCSFEQRAIIGGDKKIKSISAASIIAKVSRDKVMREMDKIYPNYGFSRNKGYGTKEHMESLKKFGLCKIHRKSFCHL